jgi:2Fe-2S ferredoxin
MLGAIMNLVTYIEHNGTSHQVQVADGETVMQGAIANMVKGIVGECGGGLACATCHCYIDEAWMERVGEPSEMEKEMLDSTAAEARPNSRLACQINIRAELSGLVVRLPASQF